MLTNTPHAPMDHNYEAVISLMQAYDCSYEDAERHLRLLNGRHRGEDDGTGQEEGEGEEGEVLGAGEQIIRFTPKELRALNGFFTGTLAQFRNTRKPSFCGKACQRLKTARRKLKCLKYLNPSRLWQTLKRRQSATYNELTSLQLNASTTEHAKTRSSPRWREVEGDWMDELEDSVEQLTQFLTAHRELAQEVRGLSGEGAKVAVPQTMALPHELQPFLFVRENVSQQIAENVKLAAEKACRVVCLEGRQFNLLFLGGADQNPPGQSIALAAYNIFQELQVLALYANSLSADQVEASGHRFKAFVIKNRLFKSILDRDLDGLSFQHQEQRSASSSEQEQQEEGPREAETHQSIIRQQDMLYQSMLSTYTARETEKQQADHSALQLQRHRQALKQSLREEPSPCPASTLQLSLRTPTGHVLARHFLRTDTLQYVKDWISASDEVEFEDGTGSFELCHGYPPLPLEAPPNDPLGSVFGGETKVRLIIKET